MAIISGFAVLAKEPSPKQFQNGTFLVEVPVYMNDYVPGVGYIKKNAIAVFWGQEGHKIMRLAQNHKKQDQTPTGGKGMPVFIAGYPTTDTFKSNRDQSNVYMEKIHVFHTGFQKIPIFESVGVVGSSLKEKTVQTANGPTLLVETLIFFNGYFPGVKNGSLNVFVSFWGEKAQWLLDKAKAHKKNNVPTGGKGMFLDIACCIYTHSYKNAQNEEVSFAKATALDVKFSSNAFVRDKSNNTSYNNQNNNQNNNYNNQNNNYNNQNNNYNNQNNNFNNQNNNFNNQNNNGSNFNPNNYLPNNQPNQQSENLVPKQSTPFVIPTEFEDYAKSSNSNFENPSISDTFGSSSSNESLGSLPEMPSNIELPTEESPSIISDGTSNLNLDNSSQSAFDDLKSYFENYNK